MQNNFHNPPAMHGKKKERDYGREDEMGKYWEIREENT